MYSLCMCVQKNELNHSSCDVVTAMVSRVQKRIKIISEEIIWRFQSGPKCE